MYHFLLFAKNICIQKNKKNIGIYFNWVLVLFPNYFVTVAWICDVTWETVQYSGIEKQIKKRMQAGEHQFTQNC